MTNLIFRKLFPQNTPLKLLIEQSLILEDAVKLLKPLFEAYFNNKDTATFARKIYIYESKADDVKFKIRKIFAKGVRIPFDKIDFLEYMNCQETLIDCTKDIAKKLSLNKVIAKEGIIRSFLELVDEVILLIDYLENAIRELKSVVYFSFSDKEKQCERKEINLVTKSESKIDKLAHQLGKQLYKEKKNMNAVDLIFIESLILELSKMGDEAENAAELLLSFIG